MEHAAGIPYDPRTSRCHLRSKGDDCHLRVTHMPSIIQTLRTKFARVEQYDVTKLAWFDETLCKSRRFGSAPCGGRVLGPVTPYRLIQGVQRIRITPQAEGVDGVLIAVGS
jgi:hypothetical protein